VEGFFGLIDVEHTGMAGAADGIHPRCIGQRPTSVRLLTKFRGPGACTLFGMTSGELTSADSADAALGFPAFPVRRTIEEMAVTDQVSETRNRLCEGGLLQPFWISSERCTCWALTHLSHASLVGLPIGPFKGKRTPST
jgi:hypothetical protein